MNSNLPLGARFSLRENQGRCGNRFWLYEPAHPHMTFVMSPMRNALIFLFPDKPALSEADALELLFRSGLPEIAERECIFVAIPVPLNGESWTAQDYDAYYNIQYVLSGGHIEFHGPGTPPVLEYPRYVYNNRQFVIGEGSGASFINDVLARQCNRIAGACTFGGTMDSPDPGAMALPVYCVSPCETALRYYRAVNRTDTCSGDTEYCSLHPLRRIILREGPARISAPAVLDAWSRLFSRTARVCVDDNIVCSNLSAKTWVLQEWPNYEELGVREVEHTVDGYVCYDIVPEGLPEQYPLVISCHGGGDDCLYHIHSCGWTRKCAEEKFLLISPDFPDGIVNPDLGYHDFKPIADHIRKVLDYALSAYSIDRSRVYIAGFSMGSSVTAAAALRYLPDFAACAVMGGMGYNDPWYEHHVRSFRYQYDMPALVLSGDADVMSLDVDYLGNPALFGVHSNNLPINGLDRLREINKLPFGCADYGTFGIWGYPVDRTVVREDTGLTYRVGSIYREDMEAPVMQLVTFEGAGHAHSSFYATLCWDFMSQFARDSRGVIRVLRNNYPGTSTEKEDPD